MRFDGFMTTVLSPTPTRVSDKSLTLIPDEDQSACNEAMAAFLGTPLPESLDFTVAVPGVTPTSIEFHRVGTAAAAFLLRLATDAGRPKICTASPSFSPALSATTSSK